ncbi:hypothetical protein SU65_11960 [Flavobacterium psychrophilum]|nr:hypothetical protein SU65_11960 [Flavobacterium psychrophilum]
MKKILLLLLPTITFGQVNFPTVPQPTQTIEVTRVDSALCHNVLQLGDVADFQHRAITNINKTLNKQRTFQKSPKPAILPNCC